MASPSQSQAGGSPELIRFALGVAATFGVITVGVVLLTVALPDGLKFVLATIAGMLTMICIGLGHVVGQLARR